VYGFLRSPRWIGLALLMTALAVIMVFLGLWQLDRFHLRAGINDRIDAGSTAAPVPLAQVLAGPADTAGAVGPAPSDALTWARVTVTGTYDPAHQILARSRTSGDNVGFEILTPLVLPNGTAVVIDRGWVPPTTSNASAPPAIPPTPTGTVTVVGRIHAPESSGSVPEPFAGTVAVRRIAPDKLAGVAGHPLYGAYVTLDSQTPPADPVFVPIAADHENSAMNAGYVVQWWMFAVLTLFGFGYLAFRQARPASDESRFDDEPDDGGVITRTRCTYSYTSPG
jgi:cytochrome oxidase assembly protein ShyY1